VVNLNKLSLTESEIKYLEIISKDGNVSVSHLCKKTKSLPSMVKRSISSLEKNGFIKKYRVGLSKKISLSDSKHTMIFRDMVLEYRHIPFYKYLSGSSLEVLSAICSLNLDTRKKIQENSNVSEPSVALVLLKLRRVGMVQKRESEYVLSQGFKVLKNFVIEFRHYLNEKIAKEFSQDSVILWERNDEFIIESSTKKEDEADFHLTGPSSFARFGIQLFMMISHHHYSSRMKKITLEDAIVDSFLIPTSQRTMLPVLLVWKKNETKINKLYIMNTSEKYGVQKFIDSVYDYFESTGKHRITEFPTWEELKSRAYEYGVKI
jgi:DNA-binding MarR family transcriptional regulator